MKVFFGAPGCFIFYLCLVFSLCIVISAPAVAAAVAPTAAELTVTYVSPEGEKDQRQGYFINLLQLALEKSNTKGASFKIKGHGANIPQGRAIQLLSRSRGLDVLWTVTTITREEKLLPVRIPLLKGLLGHRVFIIRAGDQNKFSSIVNLAQLGKLVAGQGHDWPDTLILRTNKLKVETSPAYKGLFDMLQAKRFDYFPRGVNEAWAELPLHKDKSLAVENSLLLHYPLPLYFFVAPDNFSLANRLEAGLRIAIKDGSFDRLFNAYLNNQSGFSADELKKRRLMTLTNPLLPPLTPLNEKALWF